MLRGYLVGLADNGLDDGPGVNRGHGLAIGYGLNIGCLPR
jgi:hypothetical protein